MKYIVKDKSKTHISILVRFQGGRKMYCLSVLPHELIAIEHMTETVFLQKYYKRLILQKNEN